MRFVPFIRNYLLVSGHYHFDTTPKDVEYVGYFLPAPIVYRVENAFKRERKLAEKKKEEKKN